MTSAIRRPDRYSLRPHLPFLALLGVTAAWGSTFFMIKDLVDRVPATDFLVIRFAIATAAIALIMPRAVLRLSPTARRRGLVLGAIYGAAQILQTTGLEHTTASVSGFITGMYVVITPILAGLLLRHRIGGAVWLAVTLATAGLAFLSLHGLAFGFGEALTLASAALYALHIVGLGAWAKAKDTIGLAIMQMVAVTAVCTLVAVPTGPVRGGIVLPDRWSDLFSIIYMAVVAGTLALIAQTWAQTQLSATRAAVIMCMEPVWASFFAVLLGGEELTLRIIFGGGLILTAMYVTELVPRSRPPGDLPPPGSPPDPPGGRPTREPPDPLPTRRPARIDPPVPADPAG